MGNKSVYALLAVFVCVAVLGSAAWAADQAGPVTRAEVVSFVDQAVDYARKNGKEKALAAFMDQKGPFVRGNLYIFAYDFGGTVLSHGGQPEVVGKNLIDRTDTDGKKIIVELIALARQGSGWLRYNWEDRLTRKIRPKLGYVKKVDDTWWLGSGLYEDEIAQGGGSSAEEPGPITRTEVAAFVDQAIDYVRKNGKEKALSAFIDQKGPFVRGNLYIFAYDYHGNVLSHGGQPEVVGKNLIDRTDTDGKKIVQEAMAITRRGSGWFRYNWEDHLTRKIRPKLGYVKKVDDTWWLGSGLYEDELFPDQSFLINARAALGLLVLASDGLLEKALSSLSVVAKANETATCDWEAVKPLLAAAAEKTALPGAFFLVRPDGTYFTLEQGLQPKTISDRPYFADLMAGKTVAGFLLISRSTGEQSAVVAVPVEKDGNVVGAVGASLFLAPLSSIIRDAMVLPPNQFFFAVDETGRTALHQNKDFLFNHPADMGSPSLAAAVKQMLTLPEGTVHWDLGGLGRVAVFKKSRFNNWSYGVAELAGPQPGDASPRALDEVLGEVTRDVSNILEKMAKDLSRAAADLSLTGIEGPEARKVIARLYAENPLSVDCCTVSTKGRMLVVEPADYAQSQGADISKQEQIVRLLKTKKPVLSRVFHSVEGFDAIDIELPVITAKGKFLGGVSLLFRPDRLLAAVMGPAAAGQGMEAWAMQTDGVILYEPDGEDIGRNVLTDPEYAKIPALAALYKEIASTPRGRKDCEQDAQSSFRKTIAWETTGLFGTDWRVVVTRTTK
ncbi:MAG: cache domain-containing protein [Thermodesulfobacteriota bacterium]